MKLTLKDTIAIYKTRANAQFFPCKICKVCPDYRPHPSNKLNQPCKEPWPKCVCQHGAAQHDPNFKP